MSSNILKQATYYPERFVTSATPYTVRSFLLKRFSNKITVFVTTRP